jgi:hypothetical protein
MPHSRQFYRSFHQQIKGDSVTVLPVLLPTFFAHILGFSAVTWGSALEGDTFSHQSSFNSASGSPTRPHPFLKYQRNGKR